MAKEVFTVLEAEAALYLQGDDGQATGAALYANTCINGLRMEVEYEEERLERHGQPHAPVHHTDESHTISFEQWWSFEESSGGELLDPDLDRNQRYVLVLAFYSERYRYWVKRVYHGVTSRSEPIETGDAMTDNKTLRAEYRLQVKGLASRPTMTATIEGSAVYVSGGVETVAYTYDFATETWTSTGSVDTADMGIDEGGVGVPAGTSWYLQVGTTPTLWVEDGVLRMTDLRAAGDLTPDDASADRCEIRLDADTYLLAVSDGQVVCRNVVETDSVSERATDFILRDGSSQWAATLRPGGIRCAELNEAAL